MEITQTVITAIGSLGFPIVACCFMATYIKDINTKHKEESDKMVEAINNNNKLLERIIDRLEAIDHDK